MKEIEKQLYCSPEVEVISIGLEGRVCDLLVGSNLVPMTAPGFEDGGELV